MVKQDERKVLKNMVLWYWYLRCFSDVLNCHIRNCSQAVEIQEGYHNSFTMMYILKKLLKVSYIDIGRACQGIILIYLMYLWIPTLKSFSSKLVGLIRVHLQNLHCLDLLTNKHWCMTLKSGQPAQHEAHVLSFSLKISQQLFTKRLNFMKFNFLLLK